MIVPLLRLLLTVLIVTPNAGDCSTQKLHETMPTKGSLNDLLAAQNDLTEQYRWFGPDTKPLEFLSSIESLGRIVTLAQSLKANPATWMGVLATINEFERVIRMVISDLESEADESEIALEALYRSERWDEINYSLAMLAYQQAWVEFGLASSLANGEQQSYLRKAEKGFRLSTTRLFYPHIVFNGWWGLASVALLSREDEVAKTRLELLAAVLPENSELISIVQEELKLIRARQGHFDPLTKHSEYVESSKNRVLAEEAFYLLEQHRKSGSGAIQAARRLKNITFTGAEGNRILTRLLAYKEEVIGRDIGILGSLISSEYAYIYEKYNTVILSFRKFIFAGGLDLALDFAPYRYHYAVALFKSDLPSDAMTELEQILVLPSLSEDVLAAASKLHLIVARAHFQGDIDNKLKAVLVRSAHRFITHNASDPDVGMGWLTLAEYAENDPARDEYIVHAETEGYKDEIQSLRLHQGWANYLLSAGTNEPELQARHARSFIQLAKGQDLRNNLVLQVQLLAARSMVGENILDELAAIGRLETSATLSSTLSRILFRSRLQLLDRLGADALRDYITSIILDVDGSAWQSEELLRLLVRKEHQGACADVAALSEASMPVFSSLPVEQRQLFLLQIRCYQGKRQYDAAFSIAKDMIAQFPDSGEGWMNYATTAVLAGRNVEANRGYAHIVRETKAGSRQWLQSMIARLSLPSVVLTGSAKCRLLHKVSKYAEILTASQVEIYEDWRHACMRIVPN